MIEETPFFQKYAHDRQLNRNRNSIQIDGGANPAKQNATYLSPTAFQNATGDKSVSWELEKDLAGLEDLLK